MSYYDELENVLSYIQMADGFDGSRLIQKLHTHLAPGSSILEIGMGAGKDYEILAESYDVTGSDSSEVFLELYQNKNPDARLMQLDAATLQTSQQFQGIYSNKVLQHLTRDELKESIVRQKEILVSGGIAMHSFWAGDKEEEHNGLLFLYYSEHQIRDLVESHFEILEMKRYNEMEAGDSIYVILRTRA